MIHTLQISYGITVEVANACTYRLNEITHRYDKKMHMIANYLDSSINNDIPNEDAYKF